MARMVEAPIAAGGLEAAAVAGGSDELLSRIHALHPQCFGWALACCDQRREEAEDVLQDVYVGVLNNGLKFNGASQLKTWLFGVIRQKSRDRLRRERLRELLGLKHVSRIAAPSAAPSPETVAVNRDQRGRTRQAIARLPRRQREVILLVFYHDMTVENAAAAMGVSIGSARTHYDRGKKRMAALMNGDRP